MEKNKSFRIDGKWYYMDKNYLDNRILIEERDCGYFKSWCLIKFIIKMNLYNRWLNRSRRINNQFMNYKDLVVRFGSNVERDWIIDCGYGFLEVGLIRFKKMDIN